jgi:predicted alpha/beta hydrolase family esterase
VVYSTDDPYCSADRAQGIAAAWGAAATCAGAAGHLNGDSGLGDWSDAVTWLREFGVRPG